MKWRVHILFIIIILPYIAQQGTVYAQTQADTSRVFKYIDSINLIVKQKGYKWEAGVTSKSFKTYEQLKKICGMRLDTSSFGKQWHSNDSSTQVFIPQKGTKGPSTGPNNNWVSYMSGIKDQDTEGGPDGCGDCWAHASTGVVEGLLQHRYGSVPGTHGIDLDEYAMANDPRCGGDCGGGSWTDGLAFIKNYKLRSELGENQFPNYNHTYYTISSYTTHPWNTVSIDAIKTSLQSSPVYAAMDIYTDFLDYQGGIYHPTGNNTGLYHAVVILGYDDDNLCWVCRNSWGYDWGEKPVGDPDQNPNHKGYFRIAYGACHIDYYGNVTASVDDQSCFAKVVPSFQTTLDEAANASFVNDEWVYTINNAHAENSVIIPNGSALEVNPGVVLSFQSDLSLLLNGNMVANGTSSQQITFTSAQASPAPGDWTGIVLQSGSNSLQYCNISYATNGIFFNTNTTNTISNCTIQYCSEYGIKLNGQSGYGLTTVQNSTISNNTAGLTVYAGWMDLVNSSCVSNVGYGCWLAAGGELCPSSSSISSNGNIGVYTYDATAYLRCSIDGIQSGNDYIQSNHGGQIYVAYGGAWLGERRVDSAWVCSGGGVQSVPRIKDRGVSQINPCHWQVTTNWYGGLNHLSGDYSWVADAPSTPIKAQNNYWGPPCPPPAGAFIGPVDYSYYWPCQGNSSTAQIINRDDGINDIIVPRLTTSDTTDNMIVLIRSLYKDVMNGDVGVAKNALRNLKLLIGHGGIYSNALSIPWDAILSNVSSLLSEDVELRSLARAYLIQWKLSQGNYDGAIALASAIIAANPTNEYWLDAQTMLVSGYLFKGDTASAQSIYNQMKDRGNTINVFATAHIGELISDAKAFGCTSVPKISSSNDEHNSGRSITQTPKKYVLVGNFPNPFNPNTIIQYGLPENAQVLLSVYNILGVQVKTLVNEYQTAGYKSVTFDGNNLSSGLYFYRLKAGNYTDTKKMILIK